MGSGFVDGAATWSSSLVVKDYFRFFGKRVDNSKQGCIVAGMETTTTATTARYAMYHIEWWNESNGLTVLMGALTAGRKHFTDGCHVYTKDVLPVTPDGYGEMDLVFSVGVADEAAYRKGIEAIRNAGYRVKTACYLDDRADIARGTSEQVWDYFDREIIGME